MIRRMDFLKYLQIGKFQSMKVLSLFQMMLKYESNNIDLQNEIERKIKKTLIKGKKLKIKSLGKRY